MLAPWKKSYDKPRQHIQKQRHQLTNKGLYSQSYMVFPAFMHRCESWTITEAEGQRIDTFKLWCWRRLLTVSWTARRSNQSIVKEINLGYSLGWLMLKLQYFGHLMWRTESLDVSLSKLQEFVMDREAWLAGVHGLAKSWTWLSDWTELNT